MTSDELKIVAVYVDEEGEPRMSSAGCKDCDGSGECNDCDGDGECTECKHDCGNDCETCEGTGNCPTCQGSPPRDADPISYAIILRGDFDRRIAYESEHDAEVGLKALRELSAPAIDAMFLRKVAA